jgi:hypothetical protein
MRKPFLGFIGTSGGPLTDANAPRRYPTVEPFLVTLTWEAMSSQMNRQMTGWRQANYDIVIDALATERTERDSGAGVYPIPTDVNSWGFTLRALLAGGIPGHCSIAIARTMKSTSLNAGDLQEIIATLTLHEDGTWHGAFHKGLVTSGGHADPAAAAAAQVAFIIGDPPDAPDHDATPSAPQRD